MLKGLKKTAKRIVSIIAVVTMLATLFTVPVMAKPVADFGYTKADGTLVDGLFPVKEVAMDADFSTATSLAHNEDIPGYTKWGWKSYSPTNATVDTTDKWIQVGTEGNAGTFCLWRSNANDDVTLASTAGKFVLDFNFKMPVLTGDTKWSVFYGGRWGDTAEDRVYSLSIAKTGSNYYVQNSSGNRSDAINPDRWYNVKLAFDTEARTYDFYLNGIKYSTETFYKGATKPAGNTGTALNRFYFATDSTTKLLVDDIKVYKEATGRTTLYANDFSGYNADVASVNDGRTGFDGFGMGSSYNYTISAENDRADFNPTGTNWDTAGVTHAANFKNIQKATVEFDFSTTDAGANVNRIYRASDGSNDGIDIRLVSGAFYAYTDSDTVELLKNPVRNTPYRFKINVDMTKSFSYDNGGTTKTGNGLYDVYINDRCVATDLKVTNNKSTMPGLTDLFTTDLYKACYYDNVIAYTDEREGILSDVVKAFKAAVPTGSVENGATIALPTTAPAGYDVTWTSNSSAIDATTGAVTGNAMDQVVTLTATVADTNDEYATSTDFIVNVPKVVEPEVQWPDKVFYDSVIIDENFNDMTDGTAYNPTGTVHKQATVDAGRLKFDSTGGARDRFMIQRVNSGNLTINFKFMQETKAAVSQIIRTTSAPSGYQAWYLGSDGTNLTMGKVGTVVENYQAGKWYKFQINVDYANKEFSVKVDDVDKGTFDFVSGNVGQVVSGNDNRNVSNVIDAYTEAGENAIYYLDNLQIIDNNVAAPAKIDCEINAVTFENANDDVVYGPTNGGELKSVSLKANGINLNDANLFIGVYEAGKAPVYKVVKDVAEGENTINMPLSATADNANVRFFLWTADGNITPLEDAFDLKKDRKLFILADSIYAQKSGADLDEGETGVGMVLQNYFDDEHLVVDNRAINGGSMQAFSEFNGMGGNRTELITLLNDVNKGDYVLISFAHNDEKLYAVDSAEQAPYAYGTYQWYLTNYINEIRARGGIPVLATAMPRCQFNADGAPLQTHVTEKGNYIKAVNDIGAELDVPVIDVNAYFMTEMATLKEAGTEQYYLLDAGAATNGGYPDATHLTAAGANWVAEYIASQIKALELPFAEYVK